MRRLVWLECSTNVECLGRRFRSDDIPNGDERKAFDFEEGEESKGTEGEVGDNRWEDDGGWDEGGAGGGWWR